MTVKEKENGSRHYWSLITSPTKGSSVLGQKNREKLTEKQKVKLARVAALSKMEAVIK